MESEIEILFAVSGVVVIVLESRVSYKFCIPFGEKIGVIEIVRRLWKITVKQ